MNIPKMISDVWSILTPRQRAAAIVLLGMMIVSMVFEMLGVGLMVPALAALTLDDAAPSPMASTILAWLGDPPKENLIVGAFVVLFLIYLLKTCFLLFSAYWQSRFISALQTSLSRRLFTTYLNQPWSFHLSRNSA